MNARALSAARANQFGTAFKIFCHRSGAPMTPVEQTKICVGPMLAQLSANLQRRCRSGGESFRAVQQFAFPEFTTTPRISVRDFFK